MTQLPPTQDSDHAWMRMAMEQALIGQGHVEPNPMVGCVIVSGNDPIGLGGHQVFGGPHAEIVALRSVAPTQRSLIPGSTAYVTLEPCSHHGKTGPCAEALVEAKVGRVVVALEDPNPQVAGQGIARLREAGIEVTLGVLENEAKRILAPYLMKHSGRPWVIAKWAMTIDGKIAARTGHSQWISNESSRARVHELRGRMDAIVVGIGTALADNPRLDARTPQAPPRVAKRVVIDSSARLPLDSHLVSTANEIPVMVAVVGTPDSCTALQNAGCELFHASSRERLVPELLSHLAAEGASNILVEGGAGVLGSFHDLRLIDEAHVFIGPKLIGGLEAASPVGGLGLPSVNESQLALHSVDRIEDDLHLIYRRSVD